MPRVRAAPAAAAPIAQDQDEDEETEAQLQFSEPLSWQAGKAIPTGELLKRLQVLATELKEVEQETISMESLTRPAQELAHSNLLKHKDKGVKSWAAHCLVDILRLAAPDAPFSGQQLKDIFTLFVSHSISLLADSSDAYHSQHYYVLQNLLSTKAIVLVTDIPSANSLVLALFATTFDILAQPSDTVSKNVEYQLTGLLQCLVDECQSLPSEAVDILLAQFLRADPRSMRLGVGKGKKNGQHVDNDVLQQSMLPSKQLPPAYNVAQSVCNSCVDRMSRYVSSYFSSVIIDASNFAAVKPASKSRHGAHEESDDEDGGQAQSPSKDDLDQLQKTHLLLRELWKACPGVLHTVIPQVETELSADNIELRRLATQAFGDMATGIGVEASLQQSVIDPVAYPPRNLGSGPSTKDSPDRPRAPKASLSFAHTHITAYQSFLGRRNDKAPEVRAVWTLAIGRILSTSAGGLGLGASEEQSLINDLSNMLVDGDEKVRQAAIQALAYLDIQDFVSKIGSFQRSSVLTEKFMDRLSQRSREVSPVVRSDAAHFIGKLWGASAHEIALGNEEVIELLGQIPSNILNALYLNRPDVTALIDRVMFESLIPLGYPTQRKRDRNALQNGINGDTRELSDQDADKIRVERILLLYKGLDERAKNALQSVMSRPALMSNYAKTWLKTCEEYNGGVMDQNEKETKKKLSNLIGYFANLLPDAVRASDDLWRFAKMHDRRCYALIRFCMAEDSDYRRIQKSIRELMKRLSEAPSGTSTMSETIMNLLYRISNLFYNKSHLRPIIEISSQDGHALATAAQEVLKEISQRAPSIFKVHGQELCRLVESSAPTKTRTNDHGVTDTLKACASFAQRYPQEVPKEKSFNQAMMRYVLHGTPAAAKYATSIIVWSSDKKEMPGKALLKACIDNFEFGTENYVSKLAALSQLMLHNAADMDDESEIDPILHLAVKDVYLRPLSPAFADRPEAPAAQLELDAKCWALKILTNRLRAYPNAEAIQEIHPQIYKLLTNLLGEGPDPETSTPLARASHARLRLQAALLHLKLASHRDFDELLSANAFNFLCLIAQDSESQRNREAFVTKVRKYLGLGRLPTRFYTIIFLLAFEPVKRLKHDSSVWLQARAASLQKSQRHSLENCFNRFLSVLAHHPDFSDSEDYLPDLVTYIMFYLTSVGTAANLSLIYHVTQKVKSVRDGITTADEDQNAVISHNLYYLSDLSLMVINAYAGAHNWTLQAHSGKIGTPAGVFATMRNHEEAQTVANTQFLSSDAAENVETLVRQALRKGKAEKKRKSDGELDGPPAKRRDVSPTSRESGTARGANGHSRAKAKPKSSVKTAGSLNKTSTKTPRKSRSAMASDGSEDDSDARPRLAPESADRRQSSRAKGRKSYTEAGDHDDDEEMEEWQEGTSMGSEKENRRVSAR